MHEDKCGSCSQEKCSSQSQGQQHQEDEKLKEKLKKIHNTIVVLSGKGGVGKSTVAVNLAVGLAQEGFKVGLLDVDVHGPSIPRLLNLKLERPFVRESGIQPVMWNNTLKVMSLGFLLPDDKEAVIWRGPLKMGAIRQFLQDVDWGELDYLVVDCPPGTGDEPLSVMQLIGSSAYALVVTTPQGVAVDDVKRSITFCRRLNNPVIGVIENMSGFVCPKCKEVVDIFKSGGGMKMASEMNVNFLGKIPVDPAIVEAGDEGKVYIKYFPESEASKSFKEIVKRIVEEIRKFEEEKAKKLEEMRDVKIDAEEIKIAVPIADGKLCNHFGHCEQFAFVYANQKEKKIKKVEYLDPPPHEPGVIPKWIAQQGANLVIAGGMGERAQELLRQHGVKVIVGAKGERPEDIVRAYLKGTLELGENVCDH